MAGNRYQMCGCGNPIEQGRIELDLKCCASCAHQFKTPRKMGRMVYYHKTGGEIEIMSSQSYSENKKYFTRKANRSILKQV
jgi:hypothetical protein